MPNHPKVIINADDFGWSVGVTDGIILAHQQGVLTSTTLAANMEDAPRAAARALEIPTLGVGVHLNACQGRPLTDVAAQYLADEDGLMNLKGPQVIKRCLLRRGTKAAVLGEFDAQIRRALDLGIKPTHLDSHRHVHAWPPIMAGLAELAGRYGIKYIRRPAEDLPSGFPAAPKGQVRTAALLRLMCSFGGRAAGRLQVAEGTWGIAHTGFIDANWLVFAAQRLSDGLIEIMVHPGFAEGLDAKATRLTASRKVELDALCDPAVKEAFRRNNVELVHYGQLSL